MFWDSISKNIILDKNTFNVLENILAKIIVLTLINLLSYTYQIISEKGKKMDFFTRHTIIPLKAKYFQCLFSIK